MLEHPILASLREALLQLRQTRPELVPLTRDGEPTPYLVKGAQRCIAFDTIKGPYGNAFAASPLGVILRATTYLDPPTLSNILAMEAPAGGYGRYSRKEIRDVLHNAYVGFSACKAESAPSRTVIHTGNWGSGAYGGNPVLMAFLQLCAAFLAGIDRLVFYTFTPRFSDSYWQAVALLEELSPGQTVDIDAVIERTYSRGFQWGQSDGN